MVNKTTCAERVEPSESDTTWTAAEVCSLFGIVMSGAVLLSASGLVHPVGSLKPGRSKVLNWAARYLDADDRRFLLLWAGMEYRYRHRIHDLSKKDYYEQMRMGTPSGVGKKKDRLCAKIAACLSRDAIPKFHL